MADQTRRLEETMTHWSAVVDVNRSILDRRVWVPVFVDRQNNETSFMFAAGLRVVKFWAEDQFQREDEQLRWVRNDKDSWTLETTGPGW